MYIGWLRERWEASRVARVDADALILALGGRAYDEARRRERGRLLRPPPTPNEPSAAHWRRVAAIIARYGGG